MHSLFLCVFSPLSFLFTAHLTVADTSHVLLHCRYNIVFLVLTYGIPMLVMIVCYTVMGKELWGSKSIGEHTQRQRESVKSKKKVSTVRVYSSQPKIRSNLQRSPPMWKAKKLNSCSRRKRANKEGISDTAEHHRAETTKKSENKSFKETAAKNHDRVSDLPIRIQFSMWILGKSSDNNSVCTFALSVLTAPEKPICFPFVAPHQ